MRSALLLLAACGSTTKPAPKAAAPIANVAETHTCADAALGLQNGTRGVRAPDHAVFDALSGRCASDTWPASAIDCFATMAEGDLGRCSRELPDKQRESLFAVLAGDEPTLAGLAVARARLANLQVGVAECDRFVAAVATTLTCEAMPLDTRVQLGNETADFWSLPTARLSAADLQRIGAVCGQSLASLEQQTVSYGCMP